MNGFNDYRKFMMDLQKAINGEYEAVHFYGKLSSMTDNAKYKEYINEARDDEQKHLRAFIDLYVRLTGCQPRIAEPKPFKGTFCEGVQLAFDDELEAYILYRDMILNTMIPEIRDIIFVPFSDENEHAQKFNWIISDLKARGKCLNEKKHKHESSSK